MVKDNNTVNNDPSLTKRQLENIQRKTLVNLFSQNVCTIKKFGTSTEFVEFGNEIGPLVKDGLKPFGPLISKESCSSIIQNEKEKMLLAPYSDGEDSEIEIDRPTSQNALTAQHQFCQIDK